MADTTSEFGGPQRRAVTIPLVWWLLLPVLIGAGIRFATLGHQSLWGDETATLAILHGSLGSVLDAVRANESTPPLYYYLAWFWVHVFGFSEAGVRSLSAVFGTATIVVLAVAARRLAGPRAGAAAAWFAATQPLLFWYSQEARAYSMFVLLSSLSLAGMLALRSRPGPGKLVGWTAVSVAAAATHYFAGFLVVAELGALFVWPGRLRRRALAVPAVAFIAASVPLALLAHGQYANSSFIRSQSWIRATAAAAGQLVVGYGVDPVMVGCAAISGTGLAICVWLLTCRPQAGRELVPLAVAVALAIAGPVLVAAFGSQLIDARNLLYALPAIALLAGVGAGVGGRWGWAMALPVIAGLVVLVHVYFDPTLQRTNYRGAAEAIGAPRSARVILVRMSGSTDLQQYMPRLTVVGAGRVRVREIVLLGMTMGGGLNRDLEPLRSLRFRVPGAFRQVEATATRTFTFRRYISARPVLVSVADLERRAGGDVEVLSDRAG